MATFKKYQINNMVSLVMPVLIAVGCCVAVEAKDNAAPCPATTEANTTVNYQRGACHEVIVKAKPEAVYKAILKMRDESDDTVKELSRESNHCVLEEQFPGLPIVGHATCVYKEVYTPYSRIDYSMIRSDRFKAFEGRWLIVPTADGTATKLSLSSYVDVDIPLPFAKQLAKIHTSMGVKERLQEVKSACEKKQVAGATSKSVTQ